MMTRMISPPNFLTTTQSSALFLSKHSPVQQQKCLQCHTRSRIKQHQPRQLDDDDTTNHCDNKLSRRTAICGTVTGFLMQNQCLNASGLDLDFDRMIKMSGPSAPTLEDAVTLIRGHAAALLEVKALLQEEAWSDAQRMLRKNSSNLKIDLSSIIESKPPTLRPRLRSLYSNLFNTVTKLDYAAREKDVAMVLELYEKMALVVEEVLSVI